MGNRNFIKKYFEGGERVRAHPRYRLSYATESAYWLVLCIFVWYYLKNAKKRHLVANWEKAIGCWLAVFIENFIENETKPDYFRRKQLFYWKFGLVLDTIFTVECLNALWNLGSYIAIHSQSLAITPGQPKSICGESLNFLALEVEVSYQSFCDLYSFIVFCFTFLSEVRLCSYSKN